MKQMNRDQKLPQLIRTTCWILAAGLVLAAALEAGAAGTLGAIAPTATIPAAKAAADKDLQKELQTGIEQSIRAQLARTLGQGEERFAIHVESLRITPEFTLADLKNVQVLGLGAAGAKRLDGLFSTPALLTAQNGQQEEVMLSGVLQVTGPVWVASKPLLRGHEIQSEDLRLVDLPWRTLPNGAPGVAMGALIRQRVKAHIPAGSAVYPDLIDEPFAVKNGDLVEVTVLSGPGVIIRSRAMARQEGRMGDQIRLEQPDTKKVLSGIVTGDKSVEVRL